MDVLVPIAVLLATAIIRAICDWLHNDEIFPEGLPVPTDSEVFGQGAQEMRETDLAYAERSREILIEHLGEQPIDRILAEQNAQARVELIQSLYDDLVDLYGIPKPRLKLTSEYSCMMGAYYSSQNVLELNIAYLMVNDRAVIREFLDTIFHELRHAVQHHMVKTPDFWGADLELRGRFAYNFRHYIRPNRDPEGYSNQLIEADAQSFAAAVLKGV